MCNVINVLGKLIPIKTCFTTHGLLFRNSIRIDKCSQKMVRAVLKIQNVGISDYSTHFDYMQVGELICNFVILIVSLSA